VQSDDDRIVLDYDERGRIMRGITTQAGTVSYEYDERGRLHLVTTADKVVRRYTYDDLDELTRIDEPGRSVDNTFKDGRVVKQVTRSADGAAYTYAFAYTILNGKVVADDVTEDDGTHTVYRFDEAQNLVTEVIDARSAHPISVDYDRGDDSPAIAITVQCTTAKGLFVHTVPAPRGTEASVKETLVARDCRR
jgi:YD repeat-containing protein